jgi:acetolactate synthase regulatory subunit
MIQAIEQFRNQINKIMDNGKVAQRQIERAQKSLV